MLYFWSGVFEFIKAKMDYFIEKIIIYFINNKLLLINTKN